MKKIVSMLSVLGVVASMPLYAQSKKEIIAAQQNQIQAQQQQLDSLRVANAYLQGYQDQLAGQVAHLDSANAQLSRQTLQFQHQIDSLNLVQTVLRQTIKQQAQALEEQQARANKLQQEQNRQKKAQAQQKKAQQEKENQEFQQMLAEYRSCCENSEQKLRDFFDKDKYHTNRFSQTKTMLLAKYEQQCQAGKATSLDQVKWEVQHNEGRVADTTHIGNCGSWEWHKHQYTFMVECPNGRSYQAYKFCFETHIDRESIHGTGTSGKRIFSGFIPCQEGGSSIDIHR